MDGYQERNREREGEGDGNRDQADGKEGVEAQANHPNQDEVTRQALGTVESDDEDRANNSFENLPSMPLANRTGVVQ